MKIHGLVVSVNYADLLAQGGWLMNAGLDTMTIVTTPRDVETQMLARDYSACVYETDVFYAGGAVFNKGAALSEAVDAGAVPWSDWILHFDADIAPPAEWRMILERISLSPGRLYGAHRMLAGGRFLMEQEIPGYFQLWHTSDVRVQQRPLYDVTWRHAGGYDSTFEVRWPKALKTWLPFMVRHLGEPGENWWGRGNVEQMKKMEAARRKLGLEGNSAMERL